LYKGPDTNICDLNFFLTIQSRHYKAIKIR
jgi:hypothetical protein